MASVGRIHSGLFIKKLWETSLRFGYGWRIELECGAIVELAGFKDEERKQEKIYCPIHRKYEEVMQYQKIKFEEKKTEV